MLAPATLAGLLADDDRRRVFAAISLGARTVADVARVADLGEARVQGCLPRLLQAGVVEQGDGLQISTAALKAASLQRVAPQRGAEDATDEEQRVLRNFFVEGRLVRLPARHAQRLVVLGYVARRFEPGRDYAERAVNGKLLEVYDDPASLRRYLVDAGLLERDAGVYRRR